MISAPLFEDAGLPDQVSACMVNHAWIGEAGLALTAEEEARINRLRIAHARDDLRLSLVARRMAIAERTGSLPQDVRLGHQEEGAPRLDQPEGWAISVSGVEGMTGIALAPAGRRIGLDLSRIRDIAWQPMLQMVSEPVEICHFMDTFGHDVDKSCHAFHRLWTIKEAVLKATGRGMRAGARNAPIDMSWLIGRATGFSCTVMGHTYQGVTSELDGVAVSLVVSLSK